MFRGELMPRSHNPALQKRERVLNSVRVYVAIHVYTRAVVYRAMFTSIVAEQRVALDCSRVARVLIRDDDFDFRAYVLFDVLFERARFDIFDVNCMCVGGWVTLTEWSAQVVPWLLKECQPKANGKWHLTHIAAEGTGTD